MAMLLRACVRCGGDMQVEADMYGSYRKCVQCGHLVDTEMDHAVAQAGVPAPVGAKTPNTADIDAA